MTATAAFDLAELQGALRRLEQAWVDTVILERRGSIDAAQLARYVAEHPGTALGRLGQELARVQDEFNRVLRLERESAQEAAMAPANALLTELFGQPVPGKVTLAGEYGGSKTFVVKRLISVQRNEQGRISGSVAVTDESGSCGSTERFYTTTAGRVVFAEPDIY